MNRRFLPVFSLPFLVLVWAIAFAESPPVQPRIAPAKANPDVFGGGERYVTYLSTDKPVYRPGETLFVRGVPLHYLSRKPITDGPALQAVVEIKGPKGDSVASGRSNLQESVFGYSWQIPPAQAGGEYTIKVSFPFSGDAPSERKFEIRAYRAPRLKTQIKFLRDGYGAGDEVVATLHAERAEGGLPSNSPVTVIARVDGTEAFRGPAKIDDKGNCQARFKLPSEIRRGEGTLAMVIEDGGVVETASKTIPILLQTVDLSMYPEGGDLVAGLANRVYFEAFTPARKPADLAGVILDATGKEVATFRSEHEGRGKFSFTPTVNGKYTLKITEPSGIKTPFELPPIKPSGVVIFSQQEVVAKGEDAKFTLSATAAGFYRVAVQQREHDVAVQQVELAAGASKEISVSPGAADGVLRVTVWSAENKPLAERLLFRQPTHSVQVTLSADKTQYVPGGQAKISVKTTDESGTPVSAVVGITATDDSVLEMIDKREQAPRLPVMVLLEGEVKELADAHVYLDPKNPKSNTAVDLLLGTQGWRRFAFVEPAKFAAAQGDPGRRVLALKQGQPGRYGIFSDGGGLVFEGDVAFNRLAIDAPAKHEPPKSAAAKPSAAVPAAIAPAAEKADQAKPDDVQAAAPIGDVEKDFDKKQPAQAENEKALKENADGDQNRLANNAEEKQVRAAEPALHKLAEQQQAIVARDEPVPLGARAAGKVMARSKNQEAIRDDFVPVRVFAHQVRPQRMPGDRIDFAETLFWMAGVRTDDHGQATVEFGLNDAVTSFRVFGDAFSNKGALGAASLTIESVAPFYLEPKLPLEVTMGDLIRLPLGIVNNTAGPLEKGSIQYQFATSSSKEKGNVQFTLPANGRVRQFVDLAINNDVGESKLVLDAKVGSFADKVTRTVSIRPAGFPTPVGLGGLLSPGGTGSHDVVIPDTLVAGSLEARAVVYPTPLASLNESLTALIREPCGCFEQTSSTVYPLVMAQQYFMSHQGVDPSLIEKSGQILQTGYERLRAFESKSGGYEWFGGDPGHDALTAYGLMEFSDMAHVQHVDPVMLDRTRKWLLEQRDGKGGYLRKTHTLHTWIADPECANSYNTWSLLETGAKTDLTAEVKWIREAAEKSQNTYAIALAANVLALAGDKEGENHLLDKLSGKQQPDGSLAGATTSVIGSGGDALTIETTALAVQAWLKNPKYAFNVENSIKFLAESCKGGRFGSTQSTVLALRAIVAYDKSRAKPTAPGYLQLIVDGKKVGQPIAFDEKTTGAIELPPFAKLLSPGKHQVQLAMTEGSSMPYSLSLNYHSLKPNSSENCKVHLEVSLRDRRIDEGAATEAKVAVVNRTNEIIPTPIAIVGIPGGLEVRHDQLKELVKSGKIAAYEVRGREVVLYWRSLDKEARVELPISLIAAVPGKYSGPASRAYLYYTDEHKHWANGLQVEIEPKGQ